MKAYTANFNELLIFLIFIPLDSPAKEKIG